MFRKYLAALLALAIIICGMPNSALAELEDQLLSEVAQEEAIVEAPAELPAEEGQAGEEPPEAEVVPADAALPEPEPSAPQDAALAGADVLDAEALEPADITLDAPEAAEPADITDEAAEAPAAAGEPSDAELLPVAEAGESAEASLDTEEASYAPAAAEVAALQVKNLTLGVGQVGALEIQASPEGAESAYHFSSSAKKVAAVSSTGLVKGKKAGSATITVVAENGVSAKCKVTVKAAPRAITLNRKSGVLGVGQTYQLTYTLTKKTAASVTFASKDPEVASVDAETGLVTARATGSTVITARTHNGKTAACKVTVKAAPESITLSAAEITVGQGLTAAVTGSVNAGASGVVEFRSSDENVFTVDAKGKIRGVSLGTANLIATTYVEGVTATAAVTVLPVPDKIAVQKSLTLGVKSSFQLVPEIPEGTFAAVAYKSSNKRIATVSAQGVVKGVRAGKATITVTTANGKKATCKVTVKAAPKSITLSSKASALGLDETLQLTYTLTKKTYATVTFASDRPEIASVDAETGLVTARAAGSAVVTARTHNGKTAACKVTVLNAPEAITLSATEIAVGQGLTTAVTGSVNAGAAGVVRFSSSDESVFTVDAAGRIRGVRVGTANLVATTYVEGVTATAAVTVLPVPDKVTVRKSLTLGVKDGFQLAPEIPEGTFTEFAYKSSNTKVATVSATGVVKAKKTGKATITVTTANGKKATCKVTVKAAPKSITLSRKTGALGVGEACQLTYTLTKNTAASVIFASDHPEIASVDEKTGLVTGVAPGSAVIAARTHNGKTASCKVVVFRAPDSIAIEGPASRDLGVGQALQLTATLPEGTSATVFWESSDPSVARVDDSGLVKGVAPGEITVTASTYVGAVRASVRVMVWTAPGRIALPETAIRLPLAATYQISPILPAGAYPVLNYATSSEAIASVSPEGLVTARSEGVARIAVSTYNGKTAALAVEVYDPYKPVSISVGTLPEVLAKGQRFHVDCVLAPEQAVQTMLWSSTEPDIATVDSEGTITALSPGVARVIGVSQRNSDLKIEYSFVVLSEQVCLVIPERRTGVDGIEENLKRIRAIESSAYDELDMLYRFGGLSKAEYTRRTAAVKNAFAMYAFPWMTESKMLYWKAANSEDGAKDFKPGIVYYGLPYTQTNREYNVSKAVKGGYYTKSSKDDYYLMDTDKVSSRNYKGNDCSAFVSMAYWGTGNANSYLNTRKIADTDVYMTIPWTEPLMTGDLICKGGSHVVMFLYYADTARTQIMIIEQGGDEAAINTVSCSIRTVAYYQNKKYSIRRLVNY